MASEAQHQAYVIKWSQQPSIRRQWPELALLHHIPNGGTRDAVEAKHLKQQGVKSGVPDLCLSYPVRYRPFRYPLPLGSTFGSEKSGVRK